MIEMKITGADPREFFESAAQAFMLLALGGNQVFAPKQEQPPADKPIEGEVIPPAATKGARKKAAVAEKAAELPPDGDPIPDLAGKELTLADCRERTKAIIKKFEDTKYAELGKAREDATQEEKDGVMNHTMSFMMGVFEPFGIKKAPDLKDAQFISYMKVTEKYL